MEAIKKALVENLGGPAHNLASGDQVFTLEQVPDLKGKVGVLTGGSEGVGYGSTHTLLSHNISKLFVLTKTESKVDDALDAIEKELGADARKAVVWKQCDLSDWQRTSDVAGEISNETDRIDILINNAGRGIMTQQFADTNGIDEHMAANHFGHVVLTSHLLPLLKDRRCRQQGSHCQLVIEPSHQLPRRDCLHERRRTAEELRPRGAIWSLQTCSPAARKVLGAPPDL